MKILKLIGKILLVLISLLLLFAAYIQFGYNITYDKLYPTVKTSADSMVIARGEYLVRGPAHCESCHSHPDYDTQLEAGEKVPLQVGRTFDTPLGKIYPKNLTPDNETGIGRRTDDELARIMRYSVDASGHSIIPFFMPFTNMSDDDLSAILSYLRAQKPIRMRYPSPYTVL